MVSSDTRFKDRLTRVFRIGIAITVFLLATIMVGAQQEGSPGELKRATLIDGHQALHMNETVASRSTRWGVVVSSKAFYAFPGAKASVRTKSRSPVFEFETEPSFSDPVYLFRLDRHSDRREVRVAKGFGGLADLALPKDRIVETTLEEIQQAQTSVKRYRLKPKTPLRPGEYCLSRRISVCYDFGVD
jgi:hypothetical protein